MRTRTKLYVAIAGVVFLVIACIAARQTFNVARRERAAKDALHRAEVIEHAAAQKEIEAAAYREKIEYLEHQLAEIQKLARRQDEELEKLVIDIGRARIDVERARRTRAIAATAGELCEKLAEVGHPCE